MVHLLTKTGMAMNGNFAIWDGKLNDFDHIQYGT
jgi:hypothetical protein